jgi:eukaryotic-like serine/threonine-protein kinase
MSRMPQVGEVVDDVFRIESELDHGNFGAVYRVQDLLEERPLALKVLKPGPHDEQELRQRFEREARLIYSLRHPHVLRVYYYGQTNSGLPYMAMEFLEGTDLKTLLRHHGALGPKLVKRITLETLSALEAAHELGIVHRDLKPANIFLVNDGGKGHVKVLDFGFAKALEDDSSEELTAAKTLVGTPAYMAPELVHKENVGPPSDIYAVGLIMAEMLTGEKVVQIDAIYDTILFQASDKPLKLPEPVRDSIFGDVIERAVAKSIDRRYATATDVILDLEALDLGGSSRSSSSAGADAVPREFGQADEEAMTTPHSLGLPSMQEVDHKLADGPGPSQASIDPFADFPSYEDEGSGPEATTNQRPSYELDAHPADRGQGSDVSTEATTNQRSSYELGGADPSSPTIEQALDTGAHQQPQPHTGYAQGPSDFSFDEHPAELDLEGERPAVRPRSDGPGIWKEILLGIVLGGAVLGVLLFLLSR